MIRLLGHVLFELAIDTRYREQAYVRGGLYIRDYLLHLRR